MYTHPYAHPPPPNPQPFPPNTHSDPASLNGLGHLYMHGLGVEKDLDRALQYLNRASHEKNHAESHYNLGLIYAGIVVDEEGKEGGTKTGKKKKKEKEKEQKPSPSGVKKGNGGAEPLKTDFDDMKKSARRLVDDPALAHLPQELLEMVAGMAEEAVDWERQVSVGGFEGLVSLGVWVVGFGCVVLFF